MKRGPALAWCLAWLALLGLVSAAHAAILAAHGERSFDNAAAVQFLHLALRGWGPSGLVGPSAFGDHFNPLFLAPLPVFALWPGALVLQVVKSAVYLGSVAGIALLARDLLGRGSGRWAAAVVLLSPMLWVSLFADYHSETLAAGLIPWMLLAYERRRLGWCLLAGLAVALGKENLPLVVGGLGVLALVERRDARWVLGLCGLGAAVFALGMFVVIPANTPPGAESLGPVLFGHLSTPSGWAEALSQPSLLRWLAFLLASCAGLCLRAPRKLWPLVPLLLQHGLSARSSERLVAYHYLAPMLPLLAYAALAGAARLGSTPVVIEARRQVALVVLLAVNGALLVGVAPFERLTALRTQRGVGALAARIPPNAPAWASLSTCTRLAARDRLYLIESATRGAYPGRTWPFDLAQTTDVAHALIDVRDAHVPANLARRAVDAAGDCILIAPEPGRLVRRIDADPSRWPRYGSLRIAPGSDGVYRVAIDRDPARPVPRLVWLELLQGSRVVERRPHRLLYGLTEVAANGEVYETRYRHPYVLEHPGSYELYARLPDSPSPVLLTSWE